MDTTSQESLYPEIEPFNTGLLPVSPLHTLYWEESGNPSGLPVLFVHGGPGAGTSPKSRRFFDPRYYRIILVDQRGCGKSLPNGETKDNTTQDLIEDFEKIRLHLGIEQWLLFGGSWGSTLSLLYAQAHPERVLGLILRGIFLCRQQDLDWFYYGIRSVFPDHWEKLVSHIPEEERDNLLKAYYTRLHNPDPKVHEPAARHYSYFEMSTLRLLPDPTIVFEEMDPAFSLSIARCETHYFMHDTFIRPNQILEDLDRIKHIPVKLVHGRYDMLCPVENAYTLHQAWPDSSLEIIPDGAHSAHDLSMAQALVAATNTFYKHRRF